MRRNHTVRFFMKNLIYILLPALTTSFVVTQMLMYRLQVNEKQKLKNQLEEIEEVFVAEFLNFDTKSIILFQNREFDSKEVLNNPINAKKAIELLNSLNQFYEEAESILVYYGEHSLYSGNGWISPQTYFGSTLHCDTASIDKAIDVISSEQKQLTALYNQSDSGYLLYHAPIGRDYTEHSRSVEFINSFSVIAEKVDYCLENRNVLLELSVGNEKMFFYHSDAGCNYIKEKDAVDAVFKNGADYIEDRVEEVGMNIRLFFDIKEQLAEFYYMRNLYIGLLVMGVCFSLFASYKISKKRHASMETLVESIKRKQVDDKKKAYKLENEFDYVQSILNEAILENDAVRVNERKYRQTLLEQVSLMIFHGFLRDMKEIQSILKICDIELFEEYYYVCGIKIENSECLSKLRNLLHSDIYCVSEDETIVSVLKEIPYIDDDMCTRNDMVNKFKNSLLAEGVQLSQIAVSQVYSNISMVNHAYLEVLSALKNKKNLKDGVICWEECNIDNRPFDEDILKRYIKQLRETMELKDSEKADLLLNRILEQKSKNEEKNRMIRYMVVYVLMMEIRTRNEIKDKQALLAQIENVNLKDQEAFEKEIREIFIVYFAKSEMTEAFSDILRFMKENYSRYDFSLELLAEHTGISKSQISKMFHARTGMCYIDYLTKMRLEQAGELLINTDLSIKDIFKAVGYVDITNAGRKFRTFYGVNPTTYRKQNKEK